LAEEQVLYAAHSVFMAGEKVGSGTAYSRQARFTRQASRC
jgi:hypothetical protein